MADLRSLFGMTIALNAGHHEDVLDFYTRVFGRGPDTRPMDDFLEWQICPGTWLQLSTGHSRPGANNARVRFEVQDVENAVARLAAAKVPVGEVVVVPDVVSFANFSDNWGNALGFYQLLSDRALVTEDERLLQRLDQRVREARRDAAARGEDPTEVDVDAIRRELGLPVEGDEPLPPEVEEPPADPQSPPVKRE